MKQKERVLLKMIGFTLIFGVLGGCARGDAANSAPINATNNTKLLTTTPFISNIQTPVSPSTPAPVLITSHISGLAVYSFWVSQDPIVSQIFLKDLDTGVVTQLTNTGNNSDPIWSPDGSQIMFLSWTKENSFDIYLMDRDGSHQRQIVASPAMEIMTDWSPDGNKIAFVSNKDGNDEIYVIDLQTQDTVSLTNNLGIHSGTAKWSPGSPKWSTDGKYIAFASTTGISGTSQVFIMNADGTNIRPMTDYDLYYDDSPVWCPDDSCIVFERDQPKLMLLDLTSKAVTPFLEGIFPSERVELGLARSSRRGYMTFNVDGMFYAMNMKSREIFPLDIKANDLSLFP